MANSELPQDLQRCIEFHGHLCPGLVIGYCAARAGMDRLAADRSEDEELIAIVENDSCAVDAVQVLTGCTFGKGNLFFRDYGKMAFTFALRNSGRAVRVRLDPAARPEMESVPEDQPRARRTEFMLAQPPERLFSVQDNPLDELPEAAHIHENVRCDRCGEMVMSTRIRTVDGKALCIPCSGADA